ncbi:MAG: bifunctional diaminohydroxyphosphoribosylaminopyrimidine deaminase/5-amino-6-(5-phosphoribosylamino)uracil reductase RibD [Vicinamibacterales bacterium]
MTDLQHMARALALAERGRATTSPNPMVGAVIVDDEGVVIGRGSHEVAGGPHAEILAIADAGPRARGATLFCTLEPCSHTGRTGPCAPAVVAAGLRRAVVAMEDPNPLVSGRGIGMLRERGLAVSVGLLEAEARQLNAPFLTRVTRGRPQVTLKVALSADSQVGRAGGTPMRLTGAVADRRVHRDRAAVDAIAIGSSTLLADDPRLTPRIAYRPRPLLRVVLDRRLRTPATARVFSTLQAGPVIIVTIGEAAASTRGVRLRDAGATLEVVDAGPSFLSEALHRLAASGVSSLVVEGGPTLHAALWDQRLVDRVQMYVTRHQVGPAGVPWFATADAIAGQLENLRRLVLGADVLVEGDVHRAD